MTWERCGEETTTWTMSRFNTQKCCMKCIDAEMKHPRYKGPWTRRKSPASGGTTASKASAGRPTDLAGRK